MSGMRVRQTGERSSRDSVVGYANDIEFVVILHA